MPKIKREKGGVAMRKGLIFCSALLLFSLVAVLADAGAEVAGTDTAAESEEIAPAPQITTAITQIPQETGTQQTATTSAAAETEVDFSEYEVGVDDVLDISILQPEQLLTTVTVAPDGTINFPYLGNVKVKGLSLTKIQEEIQNQLADGYMKYPEVSVALKENRSKKFFVYGEVVRPGTYILTESTTALKAISIAGGFTKFGSSSRVKVLRPQTDKSGYETIKVNLNSAMSGNAKADIEIQPQDIIVVSEGLF